MNDVHDAEPEESPYIRLPWALVAAGLGGVLLLALGLGLFANRYLRPQITLLPTPSTVALAAVTAAVPIPTPELAPTLAPTATSAPIPTTAVPATVAAPTATAPPVNEASTSTVSSAPTSAPIAPPTASPLPTVDPVLVGEVRRAYETFWQVLSQALLDLDITHLNEVMDGGYLANTEQLIDSLRTENRAIKTHVSLSYSVISATNELASVLDDEEDNSIYVNIGTEEPLTGPTADQLRVLYRLKNFSGTWKVVDSVRSE